MSRKQLGLLIVVAGALLLVLSLLADPLGIGVNEGYVFGWKQAVGTVVGVALVVIGYLVARRAPSAAQP